MPYLEPAMSTSTLPPRRHHESSAFTLIEVLTGTLILSLLVLLLLGMSDGVARLWSQGEIGREATREARAALMMMTEDLHSAVLTTNRDSLIIRTNGGSQSLCFLVAHPEEKRDSSTAGDLCAVGYFLSPGKSPGTTDLLRFHVPPRDVAEALRHHSLGDLFTRAASAGNTHSELLAEKIVRMEFAERDGDSWPPEFLVISVGFTGSRTPPLRAGEEDPKKTRRHLKDFMTTVRLPPLRTIGEEKP